MSVCRYSEELDAVLPPCNSDGTGSIDFHSVSQVYRYMAIGQRMHCESMILIGQDVDVCGHHQHWHYLYH